MVDASDLAIGAVLQQKIQNCWQPLSFFSVKLNNTQKKYSAYDRELLAVYSAVKHFRYFIEGRVFTIYTDHKPLIYALNQNLLKASPRQFRYLDFVSQFSTDIRHISGIDNVVADSLSRVDEIQIGEKVNYSEIADAQVVDDELKMLLNQGTSLQLKLLPISSESNKRIYCDCSNNRTRPYIPVSFRYHVFKNFHDQSHPSIRNTVKLLTDNVCWPGIKKDVRDMARKCISCQKSKITRHTNSPIGNFSLPSQRFSEVHVDIIGPLTISHGQRYIVTLIDRFTRWPEAVPVPDITASTVAFVVYSNWIARFGVPDSIITDQGAQFESELFTELTNLLGFQRKRTTAYNPKCNGILERFHRTLKAAIMCHEHQNWTMVLPSVLLGLRSAFREDFNASSAELLYGTNIRIPSQFLNIDKRVMGQSEFVKKLKLQMEELRPIQPSRHLTEKPFIFKDLENCSHVMLRTDALRKSLQPPYSGPHEVIKRFGKNFIININGKQVNVSIDRIKPCYIENRDTVKSAVSAASSPISNTMHKNTNNHVTFNSPVESHHVIPSPVFTRSGRNITRPRKYIQ